MIPAIRSATLLAAWTCSLLPAMAQEGAETAMEWATGLVDEGERKLAIDSVLQKVAEN